MKTKIWMGGWEMLGKGAVVVALALSFAAASYDSQPEFKNSFLLAFVGYYIVFLFVVALIDVLGRTIGMGLEKMFAKPEPDSSDPINNNSPR